MAATAYPVDYKKANDSVAVLEVISDELAVILVSAGVKKVSVASPVLLMGTSVFVETQFTDVVKFCVLPSVNVPVAVNCWVLLPMLRLTIAEAGDTVMDTSVAGVTVSVAPLEVIPESFAVIVVVPFAADVATPELLMLGTTVFEENQVASDVMSCVVLSENFPVAVNCWVRPRAILWLAGVTVIDVRTAGVTVSVAAGDEATESNIAEMTVEPSATAVASPCDRGALLMVATAVLDEVHVAHVVKPCMVLSDNVPVAMNCRVVPLAILALRGVTAIDATLDEVSVAEPVTPLYMASIVAVPEVTAVASPFKPVASLTVATGIFNDVHVAKDVKFCAVLSARIPDAVNC
jgi:hypothetical protein